jgi:hypothetical protein
MSESPYDWDAFEADQEKMRELMTKMDKCFHGYSRMVIVLACSRVIAAMYGPAKDETRQDYLDRFPRVYAFHVETHG